MFESIGAGMWPDFDDLLVIYGVLTPTTVLYWHTTAILLQKCVGRSLAQLVVGFASTVAIAYYHNWFRRNAPTRRYRTKKGKGSPYSIAERRVPEPIPVLGSQPAGYVSHKPGGRLPSLSARPAVTIATLKGAATNFAAW